jgi:hypothetical protein
MITELETRFGRFVALLKFSNERRCSRYAVKIFDDGGDTTVR